MVASWLVHSIVLGAGGPSSVLAGDTVLRSLARHLTLAVPLSTYGYNTSGTGKLLGKPNKLRGSDLLRIIMRILSRGGTNTLGRFML